VNHMLHLEINKILANQILKMKVNLLFLQRNQKILKRKIINENKIRKYDFFANPIF
jgi:hypothetical protein